MSKEVLPSEGLIPRLPQELLANIILQLIPHPTPLALPSSHPTTKTLLALTRTSRATHNDAVRLLYTYCLYIDTPERLHQLCFTLKHFAGEAPEHFSELAILRVEPDHFFLNGHYFQHKPLFSWHHPSIRMSCKLPARPGSLPDMAPHRFIDSLYLQPFPKGQLRIGGIEDVSIVHSIHDVLSHISPTLKQLVVDMPEKAFCNDNEHCIVQAAPRDAFTSLDSLELFCNLRNFTLLDRHIGLFCDEVYVNSPKCKTWPSMKTLAVHDYPLSNAYFWNFAAELPNLETVVLAKPVGLMFYDLKDLWIQAFNRSPAVARRGVTMVVITSDDQRGPWKGQEAWVENDIVIMEIKLNGFGYREALRAQVLMGKPVLEWDLVKIV